MNYEYYGNSNIYEVNVRQYTREGNFEAFEQHLARLWKMGIDILWFMPVTPISVLNRKGTLGSYYSASDYRSVNPEFGDLNSFKKLVAHAHSFGFKVIIDWVANHTGWDHIWTKTNPDYYQRNDHGQFTERNGWEDVIDLDYNNPEMRQSLIECMKFWVNEAKIDGFRCDMAMLVPLDFWKDAKTQLDKIKSLIWLGECEDLPYFEVFDIIYSWEWMHTTRHIAAGKLNKYSLSELISKYLNKTPPSRRFLFFTSNHDENSWNGTEYERYGDYASFYALLSVLMQNGIPLIYSGQELPLYKRLQFFDKDEIAWSEGEPRVSEFYSKALAVRKNFSNHLKYEFNSCSQSEYIFTLKIEDTINNRILILFANLNQSVCEFNIQLNRSQEYRNVFSDESIWINTENQMRLEGTEYRLYQSVD